MKTSKTVQWSLSGAILAALFLLASCQQTLHPEPEPVPEKEVWSHAGRIHNEMIAYYYKHRRLKQASTEEKICELLDLSVEYLDRQGYDPDETSATRQQVAGKFHFSPKKSAPGEGFIIHENHFLEQLGQMGTCSDRFLMEISKVLELGRRDESRQAIRDYVNSTFMGVPFSDPGDVAAQRLFGDILNGSYEFWEDFENGQMKGTALKKSSWVIINDGIGGVLGSVFGPLGSVVVATAFSVATNEEIKE